MLYFHRLTTHQPLDWAQRLGNVKYRTVHTTGGHFPSTETPDLLIEDIRKFFGDDEVSGTAVFSEHSSHS